MAYLLLVLTPLFWAGNFVLGRAMHTVLPPITMAEIRWSLALVIILPFFIPKLIKSWPVIRKHWKIITLLSVLSVASFNTLIYLGLTMTTAANAAIMQSIIPVIILLITVLFFKERISLKQTMGVAISLAGVLTIITQGKFEQLTSLAFNYGDLWVLAGVSCWALYSVILRWRPAELDGFTFFGSTVVVGVISLLPFTIWEVYVTDAVIRINLSSMGSVLYMAIFPSILAYLFWNRGVAELGPAKAGLFIHLMPFYGVILSAVFLGETIYSFHMIGMILIFSGIYLAVIADAIKSFRNIKRGI